MRLAKDSKPDALISAGGGGTHDTAKGIATLLGEGGKIHDHQVIFDPPGADSRCLDHHGRC
jgi:alcohol dehydrogenase class IV|tara:strand:+ start:247 stop:429 length:183 start_codon:yes stop_codon:yes gene_type:complete